MQNTNFYTHIFKIISVIYLYRYKRNRVGHRCLGMVGPNKDKKRVFLCLYEELFPHVDKLLKLQLTAPHHLSSASFGPISTFLIFTAKGSLTHSLCLSFSSVPIDFNGEIFFNYNDR